MLLRKLMLISSLLFFSIQLSAQLKDTIHFRNITYANALRQSAETGKLIFVDCYTSWCAPCKWMDKNVFTNDSVNSFYNRHFINLKIDMEKGEGIQLKEKYNVKSFPTYLFMNSSGGIIHRTASKMSVAEFLKEGARAVDPDASYAALQKKYEEGNRSTELVFEYAMALRKINNVEAEKLRSQLIGSITEKEFKSPLGWKIIQQMARNENDRAAVFLRSNRAYFESVAGKEAVQAKISQLTAASMYGFIRDKDSAAFFNKLAELVKDKSYDTQRSAILLQLDYFLETGNRKKYLQVANGAFLNTFRNNPEDLSFVARRALHAAKGDSIILKQAYVMAKEAARLEPEEYAIQGTFAQACLTLGYKEEALKAARTARKLADAETSKIQNIAQSLIDEIEKLP